MSDIENVTPTRTYDVIDIELNSSSTANEIYRASDIERLLKLETDPKQYIITKNCI